MKRFKKVLALVLAGVLALAMLTACDGGTTDSDKIMPDDGTVEVVMTINNTAANKGLGQVEYSAKYSAVTKALLENWLEWRNDGSNTKYRENYDKITAELGNVKIVVGLTKDTTPLATIIRLPEPASNMILCSRTRAHSIWLKRSALHTLPLLTALSIRRSACST